MAEGSPVKVNKKHNGKEFKSKFHFVGKVKPYKKKEDGSDSWEDVPYFVEKPTKTGKPRRSLQFIIESAKNNDLKVEVAGMEQQSAYIYSMKHKAGQPISWADRLDKAKYPDDTYTIINGTDWDRAKEIGDQIQTDQWVEVRGTYDFSSFFDDEGVERVSIKRNIEQFKIIDDGMEITLNRNNKIAYKTDFDAADFVEVNRIGMQIGIKSAYQKDEKADTVVRGVFLKNGKERSEPYDVELTVFYQEVSEGKPLADAFASLNKFDFIEITGQDNNRATYSYVDIEGGLEDDDPFNEVPDSEKTVRQERFVSGTKKGLEITGFVQGTILRGFLKEEEFVKSSELTSSEDPFKKESEQEQEQKEIDDPFEE